MTAPLTHRPLSSFSAVAAAAILVLYSPLEAVQAPPLQLPSVARGGPADPAELEAFVDGVMAAHLVDHDIAGATVAVVRNGALFWSKGYGFADGERRTPVDPATTLFRIGSVTKSFTSTGVMQLRDAGLLDLDADVNEYLDFEIPAAFDAPITLRHLMTHTPGFEDRVFGLFGAEPGVPPGEWLRENLPARVRPPGTLPSYSNYGLALAGYIVARVSGMPWAEYVEERILEPLGMAHATPREPIPDHMARHMSQGLLHEDGRFEARPFEHLGAIAPAGAISASAEAMAAFMIMHLEEGRYAGVQVVDAVSITEMHATAVAPDPRVNGVTTGLYEMSSHGLRIIGHGGGTQWFFTDMALIPDEGLGVFVSWNSPGGALLSVDRFRRAFLDHYYPEAPVEREMHPGWEERAEAYAGRYRTLRRSHTSFEKLLGLLTQARVRVVGPGEIILESAMIPAARMLEMEPGHFRSSDGFVEAAFGDDPFEGRPHLYLSMLAPMPAEKVGFTGGAGFHVLLLAFWLLTFLSILLVMPGRYLAQRKVAEVAPLRGPERWLRWAALGVTLLAIAFLVTLAAATGDLEAFLYGHAESGIRLALLFPVLAILPGIAVVIGAVLGFRRNLWGPLGRVYLAVFAVAVLVFLGHLHYWNLLGWRM